MGYTDITVRICVYVLVPLYVIPGPAGYSIHFLVWDTQVKGMP